MDASLIALTIMASSGLIASIAYAIKNINSCHSCCCDSECLKNNDSEETIRILPSSPELIRKVIADATATTLVNHPHQSLIPEKKWLH